MGGRPFSVVPDREEDGRWIAEIEAIPGCLVYGATKDEAVARVQVLALRVLADRREAGEPVPELDANVSKNTGLKPSDL